MKSAGRKSIIFRLTLLFASASTAVLLVLGLLIGNSVEHHFEVQDMEVLTGKLELTRHALEKVHSQSDLDALPQQLDDSLVGHHAWRSLWWRLQDKPCLLPVVPSFHRSCLREALI